MPGWKERAAGMTAELARLGVLDPAWRDAFEQVPRHVFVPRFTTADDAVVDGTEPGGRERWLDAVYRDDSLVTQTREVPDTGLVVPTSSSTRPSLMARMLGMLDAREGHRVLEIGTGTGYNAALLAYRLGDDMVTSIDIDPTLVDAARAALDAAGFSPTLVVGDGADGVADRAPFDRLITTCSVPAIPTPWVTQLADGGAIVADVRAETSTALITARRTGDGTVTGRFHAVPGHFMWLRPRATDPLQESAQAGTVFDFTGARRSVTALDPAVLRDPEFGFYLSLRVTDIVQSVTALDPLAYLIRTRDGSLAQVDASTRAVVEVGTRSVWAEIEGAAREWNELSRPARSQFGLTATDDGGQQVWLNDPQSVIEPSRA